MRFRSYIAAGAACVALFVSVASFATDGRYQAVPIDPGQGFGADKVLLLDTVSGHLWIWIESPAVDDDPGGRFLIYQGQLAPGKKMGEIIDKQEWPAKPPGSDDDKEKDKGRERDKERRARGAPRDENGLRIPPESSLLSPR